IQAEQDLVIRAPAASVTYVAGGPGTGHTAVALHPPPHPPPPGPPPRPPPRPRAPPPLPPDDRHLPPPPITDYAHGTLSPDLLPHAEAHIVTCRRCADTVNSTVQSGSYGPRLAAVHTALLDRLTDTDPPPETPPRRTRPPWLSALHGLRLPWLLAVVAVCAAGLGLARLNRSADTLPALLLLAPLLPLLCVAASYGGRADPFAEVTRTAPAGGLRLLLIRTGQVLALCVPVLAVTTAVLSGTDTGTDTTANANLTVSAASWLLPCLTLTLTTLLLSSYVDSRLAALLVTGGWLLAVACLAQLYTGAGRHPGTGLGTPELVAALNQLLGDSPQLVWGVSSGLLTELLVLRRHAFGRPATGGAPRTPRTRRTPRAPLGTR
ncbi:hypothetical protein OK074_8923, partial [Actinobacteria bacterium OK074]